MGASRKVSRRISRPMTRRLGVLLGASSVFALAAANFDFVNKVYSVAGSAVVLSNVLKENANFVGGEYECSDGVVRTVGANAPQVPATSPFGLEVWPDRSWFSLWNCDLTNAVWTKTNVTAVKDQVGKDGVVNGATRLTATADGGTVSQAHTLSVRQFICSPYLKRLSGTGAIKISLDGGSTFYDVTAALAAAGSAYTGFAQAIAGPQSVTNPTLVIQFGTSGDSIAIDRFSIEHGNQAVGPILSYPSPPMKTTTASVNRPHNRLSTNTAASQVLNPLFLGAWGFYWEGNVAVPPTGGASFGFVSDGFANMGIAIDGHVSFTGKSAPAGQFIFSAAGTRVKNKVAGFIRADGSGALCVNGNAVVLFTGASLSPSMTHMDVGSNGTGGNTADCDGEIQRFTIFAAGTLTAADLVTITK